MNDFVVRLCVMIFNMFSVGIMLSRAGSADSVGEIFFRVFIMTVYFVTIFCLTITGDDDENNRK